MRTSFPLTISIVVLLSQAINSCNRSQLPPIEPDVITENTLNDTDDPAIWVHPDDPSKSIVFGTDKETDGAIYAFDLNGKIIEEKTIRNIRRPNNVDVEYGVRLNDSVTTDILAFTEREKQQIRIFSVPDMEPLDGGGFPVFTDESDPEYRLPMGIGLYKSPVDSATYAIVGRKVGSLENYLYQYRLTSNGTDETTGTNDTDTLTGAEAAAGLDITLVRKFGKFSGVKEIESIAVDDRNGFIYYGDEGVCIRKYYAEPSKGNEEIACFGNEYFADDIEGIAIAQVTDSESYLIVSDQETGQFNIFSAQDDRFIKALNLSTFGTDGCEVTTTPLNATFKNGLFVAMNDEKNFYFYDLGKLGLGE